MSVTDDQVKAIIDTARDTSPFIQNAELLVDEELADKGLSDDRLDLITLYLAAHFVCITEERGGIRRSKLGDADESYVTPDGSKKEGLFITRYGQQAMMLDKSGTLANQSANGGLKARFTVIEQDMGDEDEDTGSE